MTFPRSEPPRRRRCPVLPALILGTGLALLSAAPASALRIASYNLLNYDNQAAARDAAFRTVLSGIGGVDVLAVQELQDLTAANSFLNQVLNVAEPGQWARATFFDDPTQSFNQALFYRTSAVTVTLADTLGSDPRDIAYYTVRPVGYSAAAAGVTLFIVHYKAGNATSDQDDRLLETTRLRKFLNANYGSGDNFLICGDMNIYTSTEDAYQQMVGSQADNDGRVFDPINTPGSWTNNFNFRFVHTQSTRTGLLNPNDGGATGGMDDRFDQILTSAALNDGEGLDQIESTYEAYGQDGNHFNLAISDAPAIPEGQTVADALERASDHLPVFMDFQVPAIYSGDPSLHFGTVLVGATAEEIFSVANAAAAPADELDYTLTAPAGFSAPAGSFQDAAGGGGNAHTLSMLTVSEGVKGGDLTVACNDLDNPVRLVPLSGTVLRHAVPSLAAASTVDSVFIDFGAHTEGGFPDTTASVHNRGYTSLQGLLEVHAAQLIDPSGRFSIVGGFTPFDVEGTPVALTLRFDAVGATGPADSTFTATLLLSTRDDQALPGATALPSLEISLAATVVASQTGVDDGGAGPLVTRLFAGAPNPFAAGTMLSFDLAEDVPAVLSVYDVQGRLVATLLDGPLGAGRHQVAWGGADDAGRNVSPGLYFGVLRTPSYRGSYRLVKLR